MNDDDLHSLLKQWEIDLPDDPRFRASVWREIATRDSSSCLDSLRSWLDRFSSPRLALPLGACAALAVMGTASLHGLHNREQTWSKLASTYASAIDPVMQMERESSLEARN
ncbi:MAG: hypothetical protein KDN19_13130 [Verrucomicrobiae bacterium]|nr:hypothetical protein [Verrucomicrobiae bacterium]MCB1231210.1 hypothetical protein [Verrucomicrobiae bacterium]